jgi:hypothetical protein
MGIFDIIKVAIGYDRKSHTYDSSKIREGEIKMLSGKEMIKNEKGKILVCRKNSKDDWKCRRLNIKPR